MRAQRPVRAHDGRASDQSRSESNLRGCDAPGRFSTPLPSMARARFTTSSRATKARRARTCSAGWMTVRSGWWMRRAADEYRAGDGVSRGLGAGRTLGQAARTAHLSEPPSLAFSHTGAELDIPVTVHIAIGTDIIHQHPTTNGAVLGEASYRDFQTFAAVCAQLEGGVVLNSAAP